MMMAEKVTIGNCELVWIYALCDPVTNGNPLEQGAQLDGSGTQEDQRREAPCRLMKSR